MGCVICAVCHKSLKRINGPHLKKKHGLTTADYRRLFPDASMGASPWNKGKRATALARQHVCESHWARKPVSETAHIRQQCAENGRLNMSRLNADGRAFRMPKGYHTDEHKQHLRELMTGRVVTWGDKISENHWTKKPVPEIDEIMSRIFAHGTHRCKTGTFVSSKMHESFSFMSSWEERRMRFLDTCDDVFAFTNKHGIWIDYEYAGKWHRYNPDLLIEFHNGVVRIEEVKGYMGDEGRVRAKEMACVEFVRMMGYEYRMIRYDDLDVL